MPLLVLVVIDPRATSLFSDVRNATTSPQRALVWDITSHKEHRRHQKFSTLTLRPKC